MNFNGKITTHQGASVLVINGHDGNDRISVPANVGAVIRGDAGNDTIYGNGANDLLEDGDGADYLDGGTGNDTLAVIGERIIGQQFADTYLGRAGRDTRDTIDYGQDRLSAVSVSLDGVRNDGSAGENDLVGADIEDVIGSVGHDTLVGSARNNELDGPIGNDLIFGRGGDDSLYEADGDDSLYGEGGNDYLEGSANDDHLSGGAGRDRCSVGPATTRSTRAMASGIRSTAAPALTPLWWTRARSPIRCSRSRPRRKRLRRHTRVRPPLARLPGRALPILRLRLAGDARAVSEGWEGSTCPRPWSRLREAMRGRIRP